MKCSKLLSLIVFVGMCPASCQGMSSPEVFIEYRRSGGFAGVDDHLVIDATGRATVDRKTAACEFDLDDNTINQLRALFDDMGFSRLSSEGRASRRGPDFFEYTVTYKTHTVRTIDGSVPESLWPMLESLNQVVEGCGESK